MPTNKHESDFDDSIHPESCYSRMRSLEQRCDALEMANARKQNAIDVLMEAFLLVAQDCNRRNREETAHGTAKAGS